MSSSTDLPKIKTPYDDALLYATTNEAFYNFEVRLLSNLADQWRITQGILRLCLTGK